MLAVNSGLFFRLALFLSDVHEYVCHLCSQEGQGRVWVQSLDVKFETLAVWHM